MRADRPDLRLVPGALAAWAVALVGVGCGAGWALVATAAALVAAVVGAVAGRSSAGTGRRSASRRPLPSGEPPGGGGRWRPGGAPSGAAGQRRVLRRAARGWPLGGRWWGNAVLAGGGCALAAGLAVSASGLLVASHPLAELAARGAAANLQVVVRDDPRPIRATAFGSGRGGGQVLVPAALTHAIAGPGSWTGGGRVLLIAPAEGWSGLLPGQPVAAEGVLAPAARADLTVAVLRVRGPPQQVGEPPWWQAGAGGLRAGLRDAAAVLPEAPAGLLPGLAVGDTSRLPAEVEDDFRAAGLTHLVAVSGANLAIVGGAVLAMLRLFRADPRLSAVLVAAAVVGFVVLARPSPSVVRAAVMGGVALLALALGRGRSAVPALAVAVLVLLVLDPALAVDPGFALSVLATGALVLLAPGWAAALQRRRVPQWAAEALAVPAAAFVVTAPVVAGLSGVVSPVAVVANLLAVPAVAPATVLGVLAAALSPIAPPLAQLCAWLAWPAVGWLVQVADRAAAVPGASVSWPEGVGGALLLAGVVIVLLVIGRGPRLRALLLAVALGLAVVLVPTRFLTPGWPPPGWAAVACDVGQGDAIVLATGRPGVAVLVDAGPEDGPVDACLDRLGVHTLAMVVLSHLHADHIGGIAGALRERAVGGIAVGPVREPRWALRSVAVAGARAGAPLVALTTGQRLRWPGLALEILGPRHPDPWVDPEDGTSVNDGSVVLRATTAAGTVLLAGDIEPAAQAELLDSGTSLRADILKLPHHGSRYTAPAFLSAVAPRAVLVSVGAGNRYGHPDRGLLDALVRAAALVRRTDESGDTAVTGTAGNPEVVARGDPLPAR